MTNGAAGPNEKQTEEIEPALYGISQSNRTGDDLWGKNQFNSSFPVSLACYMRDNGLNAVYLTLNQDLQVIPTEISFDDIFNTQAPNEELYFSFETKYNPYQVYAYDDIGHIDLTVKQGNTFLRPLEIKLTVMPDSTTYKLDEAKWGSEIVIRPASTSYCALGIVDSFNGDMEPIRQIFEPVCNNIRDWGNKHEIQARRNDLLTAIDNFQTAHFERQKPFLMQPIWKTRAKSPILADHAFDIFIWSDFALCRLFLDQSLGGREVVNRYMRSSARMAKFLFEVSTRGKVNIRSIYTEMGHDLQTDKEFAVSGKKMKNYMNSPRRINPSLSPDVLRQIILNGGEKMLSPERRFDQSIYYTAAHMFVEQGE